MPADPRVGTELAGHRLVAVIGRGGMSVVYLAEHLGLQRKVALKVLGLELAEDDAFRERFIRESRITAGLDHPNIVTVYDAGEADGILYISMRYVEGTDLERLLRLEGRLDPVSAVSIISQSAAALDAAHAEGLVHRDVKPGNILLTSEGHASSYRAYLSDFGITKRLHTGAALTRTGQFVGTVDYVAPEQIQGEEVDGRADVYALACVLYRCLTGEVPFPRDTEVGTIYAHLQDRAPVPSERRPDLPHGLDAPIARALAKSRDDRFETCERFAETAAAAIRRPSRPNADPIPHAGSKPARRRRPVLVWGSFAIAIAIAAAVILSQRFGSGAGATGSPLPPLPQMTWSAVGDVRDVFGGVRDQDIVDAAQVDGTLVAVGRDDAGVDGNAAVWTSADGTRWTRIRSESLGRSGDQRMDAVTVLSGTLVVVGSERTGGDTDPAVWRSVDAGTTWARIDGVTSGLHEKGKQAMRVVLQAPSGLMAAGSATSNGSLDAAVWTSPDGTDWTRLIVPSFGGTGDQAILGGATLGGDVVAVGLATTATGDRDAAAWVGTSGGWSRVQDISLGGPGDQQITAIVAGGPGLVAVGSDNAGGNVEAAVWTSADGRSWQRVSAAHLPSASPGDRSMSTVTLVGSALVAGGSSDTGDGRSIGAIWFSADGTSWTRQPADAASTAALDGIGREQIASLLPFGGRLLAVGSQRRADDDQAAVWIADVAFPGRHP